MSEQGKEKGSGLKDLATDSSLVREMLEFLRHNKKFWLLPILIVLGLLGLLIFLGGTAAAPFIYTLF